MDRKSELKTQDLLDSVTESIQRGGDVESADLESPQPDAREAGLISIIRDLDSTLVAVEPSAEFSDQLRSQLLGERSSVMKRVRQMPARVHVAAVLAVIAGFVLLWTRRLSDTTTGKDITDEPIAAPL